MPELPEVQTTVDGINKTSKGRIIKGVWTSYKSAHKMHKGSIKEPLFFKKFKKIVVGEKIIKAERRAKNVLIHLTGGHTILAHMKMTGFFFYNPPEDAKFMRLIFELDNGKVLGFSDMRKFAKVTLIETSKLNESIHLAHLGPEPLSKEFNLKLFISSLMKKSKGKIKTVLMDQTVVSGIGNIYSDEILWLSNVHPLSIMGNIPLNNLELMFKATKETLNKGIDFGGDSMSDYKNIYGKPGKFQNEHNAYKKNKTKCKKRGCGGLIERLVVGGRSAHFCPVHQELFK